MTLRLILMRHAKSAWDDPTLSDHDRVLNARGAASAKAMGAWLRTKGYVPDTALISSSARTQETFTRLGFDIPVHATRRLYLAEADQMLADLQSSDARTVLMIGHNPGNAEMAEQLVQHTPDHTRFHDYPTGATTVIDWDVDSWKDIGWHTQGKGGQPIDFAIPREVMRG